MSRGRPTDDPKTQLVAVRLAPRHVDLVERRIVRENVSFSEALRRFLDEADEREKRRRKKQKPAKQR
jgi:hypothetical protein